MRILGRGFIDDPRQMALALELPPASDAEDPPA
jgi:hypothetical protein